MAHGGKGAPLLSSLLLMMAVASLILEATAAVATKHVVGGTAVGWTIPPNSTFYPRWSSSQTFAVGDSLVFNFPTGAHNVIQVDKSGYDACSSAKGQIGTTLSSGPATILILSAGEQYYICGVPTHCSGGQKLAITVSTSSSAPSPSPSPSPSAVVSLPPAAGGPTMTNIPTSATGSPAPSSSAPAGLAPSSSTASGQSSSDAPSLLSVFCLAVIGVLSMASTFLFF